MIETQRIEGILLGPEHRQVPQEDCLVLEAQSLTAPDLAKKIQFQKRAYQYIRTYGRRLLRLRIKDQEKKLFTDSKYSDFQNTIQSIFK